MQQASPYTPPSHFDWQQCCQQVLTLWCAAASGLTLASLVHVCRVLNKIVGQL